MGLYLDALDSLTLYKKIRDSKWYIDKTEILSELIDRIGTTENYICVTRPRRFGKTVAANMIAAFFSRNLDSKTIFDGSKISENPNYDKFINSYHVISIDFSKIDDMCQNYDQYISTIKDILVNDLKNAFPEVQFREGSSVAEDLRKIFNCTGTQFVFVLDEWDAAFRMSFISEADRARYLLFLKNLLKDQAYVALAYITGTKPIAKYSRASELSMFLEYTMTGEERFSKYYGFLQEEVSELYQRYLKLESNLRITLEDLGKWYGGYHTFAGDRVYDPYSVVEALTNNSLRNYQDELKTP